MPPLSKIHFSLDVVIPRIMEIGMVEAPKEACGIIVPDLGVPVESWVIQLTNRADNPQNSYVIDVATVRGLLDDLDGWEDVLIWHTHPGGLVGPSQEDMRSRLPGLRYLVVSLPRGETTMF